MVKVTSEIEKNYLAFSDDVSKSISANISTYKGYSELVQSYARIASINALKIDIVESIFPDGAAQFFYEAHNDAILSHVNASFGSWRPALQSLRSFMENTMASVYYLDHPVEFKKWSFGAFNLPPKDQRAYIAEHPNLIEIAKSIDLKAALDKEYSTLSKAVHGSDTLFRMTSKSGSVNIANPNAADLSKWSCRERSAMNICLTAVVAILANHLDGAKMTNLRTALSYAIQSKNRTALKKHMGVSIPSQGS